ncbi:hypothetical protein [Terricaulis sp.]|uniref:hypothetical protein n=1 Tax=Terricaulis sp. TaxID=2768686 RepID=UPI003782F653
MVSSINNSVALSLLTQSSSGTVGIGADLLTAAAKAKAGIGVDIEAATQDPDAPLAPVWTPGYTPGAAVLIARANAGKSFFDPSAKLYSDLGATGDYKNLFALHTGLQTLNALAGKAQDETLSNYEKSQVLAQFTRGMSELSQFFNNTQFEDLRLAQGDRVDAAQTTLALPSKSEDYQTGVIHRGSLSATITGLDANATFTIQATSATGTVRNVSIDLSQMGTSTRSLSNVISFVNSKLSAAGALSRLEAVDQTPKTTQSVVAGRVITTKYAGAKQYALKVDVRGNEKVAFNPVAGSPAFYVVGDTSNSSRLIKISDVSDAVGQPVVLERPAATIGAIGAAPGYAAGASQYDTTAMVSAGVNNFEDQLAGAGEATLKLAYADGRTLSVSTAWRSKDLEDWNIPSGQSDERGRLGDLAQRLTQLLHEQGVAATVQVWEDGADAGLSVLTADDVSVSSLQVGSRAAAFDPAVTGGLDDGVFARRFEAGAVANASDLYVGAQSFTFTTATGTQTITIDGGENGVDAASLVSQLNVQLGKKGIRASASLVDNSGVLTLRVDAMHEVLNVSGAINEDSYDADLVAPGAWASGGLPAAGAGEPYGDAVRDYSVAGSPLSTYAGALDIQVVVATPQGDKTISVSVSAQERIDNPDVGPGAWAQVFQDRLDAALNAAGVYVGAQGGDLTHWRAAEDSGQRIQSISVNSNVLALNATAPASVGGAFGEERSFTSAQAAAATTDDVAALISDPTVSITFDTIWGQKTIAASLQSGDARTLESAALRLNEALAAAGYDLGAQAAVNGGGGAGLRIVSGGSHTIRAAGAVTLGGTSFAVTLDPVDANDAPTARSVAERAARGAAVVEATGASTSIVAPSANASAWFPGRAFDVSVGGGAKVATARAVATGVDGSVYVLADLNADGGGAAIKGARDVALFKYDSAGKLAFTEVLGAANTANGFALAVSTDGKVAIAGNVEGGLSDGGVDKGGADSFVAMLDASGKTLWTARRGAAGNDEIRAMAFAPDGSLVVAGKTESALGASLALGGADAYLRGYSATGAELFTRQFGTGREDAATALMVRDNGAGGVEIVTGGVEDNRGVLRSFTYSSGSGLSAGATRDIGYFYKGEINAIAANGGELHVGGAIGADRLSLDETARGAVAGQEGFVARLDSGLVSHALDRATYLGSAQDDSVKGLAVVGGQVYASGLTGGVIAGQGTSGLRNGFITRIGDDGGAAWTRTFTSAGGTFTANAMAVDQSGASALDILGLPRGVVAVNDSGKLTDRSALRADDEFKIGVDGRRLTTVKIGANDTLASLVATINRALGSGGRAEIVKADGKETIKIAARDGKALRIEPGREGHDALSALGLTQGVIAVNASGHNSLKTFGLGLVASDLKIDTKTNATKAKAEISAAISIVRQAYETLLHPNAKEQTDEEKRLAARKAAAGAAPEYYTQQLQNYQAALSRLSGG